MTTRQQKRKRSNNALTSNGTRTERSLNSANDDNTFLGALSRSSSLAIASLGSINVKNVTSKAGVTQSAHHLVKSAACPLVLRALTSELNLQEKVIACSLVYDTPRQLPMKPVDFPTKKKLMTYDASVEPQEAKLSLRVALLSSQVENELFRIRIDISSRNNSDVKKEEENNNNATITLYTPPIVVVSKPYLALRKEGERGKPVPAYRRRRAHRRRPTDDDDDDESAPPQFQFVSAPRSITNPFAVTAVVDRHAGISPSSSSHSVRYNNNHNNNNVSAPTGSSNNQLAMALCNLQREQAAQRRMLERILAQQQQQHEQLDDNDAQESSSDEYVPHPRPSKRARHTAIGMKAPRDATSSSSDVEPHSLEQSVASAAATLAKAFELDPQRAAEHFLTHLPSNVRQQLAPPASSSSFDMAAAQAKQESHMRQQSLLASVHFDVVPPAQHSDTAQSSPVAEYHGDALIAADGDPFSSPSIYSDDDIASVDFAADHPNALFLSGGQATSLFEIGRASCRERV